MPPRNKRNMPHFLHKNQPAVPRWSSSWSTVRLMVPREITDNVNTNADIVTPIQNTAAKPNSLTACCKLTPLSFCFVETWSVREASPSVTSTENSGAVALQNDAPLQHSPAGLTGFFSFPLPQGHAKTGFSHYCKYASCPLLLSLEKDENVAKAPRVRALDNLPLWVDTLLNAHPAVSHPFLRHVLVCTLLST